MRHTTDTKFEPGEQSDSYWCICPHCGLATGDTWEWLDGHHVGNPLEETCERCGKKYRAWAEHEVTYYTEPLAAPTHPDAGKDGET